MHNIIIRTSGIQFRTKGRPRSSRDIPEPDLDATLLQSVKHRRLVLGRDYAKATAPCVEATNLAPRDYHLGDLTARNPRQKLGIADLWGRRRGPTGLNYLQSRKAAAMITIQKTAVFAVLISKELLYIVAAR